MPTKQKSPNTFPFPDLASSIAATNCDTLKGLSPDEIRVWALCKSEEHRLLSYTMLSVYNDAAPIHALPVELLMKIFGMTWTGWERLQGLRPTSVCRRWRTVYLATPEFWAEAVTSLMPQFLGSTKSWYWCSAHRRTQPPPECVAMLLERSWPHPIPLDVTYEPPYVSGAVMITIPTQCVLHSTVFTHPIHVVKLNIDASLLHLHRAYCILKAGMPALEELDLQAREEEPPDLARTLASLPRVPDESLPRLRSLSRLNPAIFFPLIAVRSLEYVYLEAWQDMTVDGIVPWPHPPGSESRSLLRALARCSNLKYLYLEYYEPSRWWPPLGDEGSDAIYLPSLRKLCFPAGDEGTEEPYAQAILEALDPCIPSTAFVNRGVLNPRSPDSLSQLMPAYLVQHHPFDTVIISPSDFHWNTSADIRCLAGQELRLNVRFSPTRTLADLGIEDVFRAAHVTHLEIIPGDFTRDAADTDLVEDWAGVLRAFPHLTHLTVSGVDAPDRVVDALGALAKHHVATYSEVLTAEFPGPLCPTLRHVTLGWEVPREIGPKDTVRSVDLTAYRKDQDVRPRVEQRCSALQVAFERRASMGAENLHALEFYEYEMQGHNRHDMYHVPEFGELIASSRRDDNDLSCLERLRAVVGGPVVYRGYMLKTMHPAGHAPRKCF